MTFGLRLHCCGSRIFGIRVWCDWRMILVLKLMVPKVKNVVKKCTSLSIVYCICIDYSVFLFIFLSICGEVHMVVVLLIRIIFFFWRGGG